MKAFVPPEFGASKEGTTMPQSDLSQRQPPGTVTISHVCQHAPLLAEIVQARSPVLENPQLTHSVSEWTCVSLGSSETGFPGDTERVTSFWLVVPLSASSMVLSEPRVIADTSVAVASTDPPMETC